jgi:hypothetical protein
MSFHINCIHISPPHIRHNTQRRTYAIISFEFLVAVETWLIPRSSIIWGSLIHEHILRLLIFKILMVKLFITSTSEKIWGSIVMLLY